MTLERFDFAPVEALVRAEWSGVVEHYRSTVDCLAVDIALRLGVPVQAIHRYRRDRLSLAQADRIAIELGTHPALIWPEQWQAAA